MYQLCKECEHWYKPQRVRQQKYCSEKCARVVANRRRCEKQAKSLITGFINGRPLWEDRFIRYKKNAANKGIVFELDKEYFRDNWDGLCYYCGDKIPTIGVDRVDNHKGYIISNVVICCGECNKMKRGMSQQDFIKQCQKIAKKH